MIEASEYVYRWHRGEGVKPIARSLGADPKTVRKILRLAQLAGLRRELPLPAEPELVALLAPLRREGATTPPTPGRDRLAPHHALLEAWAKEEDVTIKQMWRLLQQNFPDLKIGYNCLKHYVRDHFRPHSPRTTVRLHVDPGQQAQVDFGYVGLMVDPATGKPRKTWAFIMTLAYSRYRFVRFVFRQDTDTWVDCHVRAFAFFGAVPHTILLDNLKAGVLKPDLYDPLLNPRYRECEHHYHFAADPARARHPELKGRVERSVPVVREQLLAGRHFQDIDAANAFALEWCRDLAGQTLHGTTKRRPHEAFLADDRPAMLPLPPTRLEPSSWQQAKVHFDHTVIVRGAYYSVPTRFIGATLWVRASERFVRFFQDGRLVKTHLPVAPGQFQLDPADYPERQRRFMQNTAAVCLERGRAIGAATTAVMERAISFKTQQGLRKAQALLRLAERHGPELLEAACRRALHFDNHRIDAIRTILDRGLALVPLEPEPSPPSCPGFVRTPAYFAHR